MSLKNLSIILYTAIAAFCALYAPQPLLALLSQQFQIDPSQTSLLITVTLLPLGLAPIFYGLILESVPSRTLLKYAVFLLAVTEIAFILVDSFWLLLTIRCIQGLLFPAIFTALMTYISTISRPEYVKKKIAYYVAATILGGFLGRFITGLAESYSHWHHGFILISGALFIAWGLLHLLDSDAKLHFSPPSLNTLKTIIQQPVFSKIYLIIFLSFFCFASVLNILPFHVSQLEQGISTLRIAMLYSGYLMGIIVALNAIRITHCCQGEAQAIFLGLSIYTLAILGLSIENTSLLFVDMFLFCGGMFLIHSVLSGYLNHLATQNKGVINGLYIACYYAGGTLGSYFPNYIYHTVGWRGYVVFLTILVSIALFTTYHLFKIAQQTTITKEI